MKIARRSVPQGLTRTVEPLKSTELGEIPESWDMARMGDIFQMVSGKSDVGRFPLPWSAYVRLLAVKSEPARPVYEQEAPR